MVLILNIRRFIDVYDYEYYYEFICDLFMIFFFSCVDFSLRRFCGVNL